MTTIYVLACAQGKYYVGRSNDVEKRLAEHKTNNGAEWTKRYPPLKIIEQYPNCDDFDEDKYTIKTMEQYGINNVRGGSFVRLVLDDSDLLTISKMLKGAGNQCFACGSKDHFIANCPDKPNTSFWDSLFNLTTISNFFGNIFTTEEEKFKCSYCEKQFDTKNGANYHELKYCKSKPDVSVNLATPVTCFRCGREGHYSPNCYAKKHINGHLL